MTNNDIRYWATLGAIAALACGNERAEIPVATVSSAIVFGADQRVDGFDCTDPVFRDRADRSTAILVSTYDLDPDGTGDAYNPADVKFANAGSLGSDYQLCPDERFYKDTTAARCSATLIDDDLILTAGHCFDQRIHGTSLGCSLQKYVFNFRNTAPSTLGTITGDDVFSCAETVVKDSTNEEGRDYAIVRLDRPATPRFAPAAVKQSPLFQFHEGEPLVMIGSPSGIPIKIAPGKANDPAPNGNAAVFDFNSDGMQVNSGSAIYDAEDGAIGGILVAGPGTDYELDPAAGCMRNRVCDENAGCTTSNRKFLHGVYVAQALRAMCEANPAQSHRLCGAYLLAGDADGDGSVTHADALLISKFTVGLDPEGFFPGAADVNSDGKITIVDALLVQQYVEGLVGTLPVR